MPRISSVFFVVLTSVLLSCGSRDYDPDRQLSPREKEQLMMAISRYVAKAPENITDSQRFLAKYDDHYRNKMREARLERFWRKGPDSYFMISQPAPSLTVKRHATAGKLTLSKTGEVQDYEEIFRTWKLTPDTLKVRSYFLFDLMVKGEPLSPYYSKRMGDQYIEFPDDRTFFDRDSRSWKLIKQEVAR